MKRTVVQILDFKPQVQRSSDLFLLKLAEKFHQRGWKMVHVFSGEPAEPFRRRLVELDSPYFVSHFPLDKKSYPELVKNLRGFNPDIVQTTFMSCFNPFLWKLKGAVGAKRWIVLDQSSGAGSVKTGLKQIPARIRGAVAGAFMDRILTVSQFVAQRDIQRSMLPRRKIKVIYNGIDIQRFHPDGPRITNSGVFTIAFAGQLIEEKGVDLLLEAASRIAEQSPILVKIAGAGKERPKLEELARKLLPERYEFCGQVEDLPAFFRSADVAVFPSRWEEAFGLVVAEAMACGIPVIASDAGGIPEVVGSDGGAGLIFRKNDVDDLTGHLRTLRDHPQRRKTMGLVGRARVEKNFSIDRMVEQYMAVYEDILRV